MVVQSVTEAIEAIPRRTLDQASLLLSFVEGVVDMAAESGETEAHVRNALYGALEHLRNAKRLIDDRGPEVLR